MKPKANAPPERRDGSQVRCAVSPRHAPGSVGCNPPPLHEHLCLPEDVDDLLGVCRLLVIILPPLTAQVPYIRT